MKDKDKNMSRIDKKKAPEPKRKKRGTLSRWFRSNFLRKHDLEIPADEIIETPLQIVAENFFKKKTAVFGVVTFTLILLLVLFGPSFYHLDLGEHDSQLVHIPPGYNMMKMPDELHDNIRDLTAGNTFGLGVDNDGLIHIWGHTRVSDSIDLKEIPEEVQEAELRYVAAGTDHVVAMDEDGELYFWGNDRLGQTRLTPEMQLAMMSGQNWDIVQLVAGNQSNAAVDSSGYLYLWGNANNADLKVRQAYQGNIVKVDFTSNEYVALLNDGNAAYPGFKSKGSPFEDVPEELIQGKTIDVAATSKTMAGLTEDGEVFVWGTAVQNEKDVPEFSSKPVRIEGGRAHYSVLCEDGSVVSWGNNSFGQTDVVSEAGSGVVDLYLGDYQNYAIKEDGNVATWGLKGFLLGTDGLGRDMLTRIINGGRVTMLVGAIAVVIATIIGVVLGGLAGYFGGKVDLIIMRISEIVGGLPFIPFAMILSAVIGSRMEPEQRMYLIMVVLGVLSWVGTCRLVRAQFFAQREMEYVTAAKAMGIREVAIIFRHIMPNIFSILLVSMTLDFATAMLTESTLSYLGFGIPLPTPTWGNLLSGANNSIVIQQYWWLWVFPAAIFGLCTICINLIGDALRDAMDPKSAER
ncbi:MAG: ABC transporter permease subunit [Fastidiosipila sp.]|nr:ABC transporter permease subunit [Fastidiosipila sp.]